MLVSKIKQRRGGAEEEKKTSHWLKHLRNVRYGMQRSNGGMDFYRKWDFFSIVSKGRERKLTVKCLVEEG